MTCPKSLHLAAARSDCDSLQLGLALRLTLLCEIDQSALPEGLHADLRQAARKGHAAATTLLDWREARLLDAIEELENRNVAQ